MVIDGPYSDPFIMCTIPKVGCSNFRKLMRVLFTPPEQLPQTQQQQLYRAHFALYPTIWHYNHTGAVLDDSFPAFAIGRDPCDPFNSRKRIAHRNLGAKGSLSNTCRYLHDFTCASR